MTSSSTIKMVTFSGSTSEQSKTNQLIATVAQQIQQQTQRNIEFQEIKLSELAPYFNFPTVWNNLPRPLKEALQQVENADFLIVGTPVYRASFTGLFKHFFDHVAQDALVGKHVLLTASGGSDKHALVLEHQLRPLFSFFQAHTLPIGVYAVEADFDENLQIHNPLLKDRITLAVNSAVHLINKLKD